MCVRQGYIQKCILSDWWLCSPLAAGRLAAYRVPTHENQPRGYHVRPAGGRRDR